MTVKPSAAFGNAAAATIGTRLGFLGTRSRSFATTGEAGIASPNRGNAAAATVGTGSERRLEFVRSFTMTGRTGRKGGHNAKPIFASAATVGTGDIERRFYIYFLHGYILFIVDFILHLLAPGWHLLL